MTKQKLLDIISEIWQAGGESGYSMYDIEGITEEDFELVKKYLLDLPNLLEKANELDFLKSIGVDNWENYQTPVSFFEEE